MSETVDVLCSIPNGIVLRLYEPRNELGFVTMVPTGEEVTLAGPKPGEGAVTTSIDRVFLERWTEQNPDNPMRARGLIRFAGEAEPPPPEPKPRPADERPPE